MEDLAARIDAIDRKLDYVVGRQRYFEELVEELTPVAREAIGAMSGRMAEWEAQGWFEVLDPTHVRLLLATIRNVTQPDVLEMANEAAEVLHHADELKPVGVMGAVRASSDGEVQRGLAVALEILKHLGRAHGGDPSSQIDAPRPSRAPAAAVPPPDEVVVWEGVRFTSEGFLVDPSDWSEGLARKVAVGLDIALTDEHWTVLRWARADYSRSGASPNVRRAASGSGVGTRRMYELFPNTPGKSAAMIAGIPKPVGCV